MGLKKKSSILDAGCGQGFFSYLLDKCGMKVYGLDISESGIRAAKNNYRSSNVEFIVGDIQTIPFISKEFDCVFIRSCSFYNTDDFSLKNHITDYLLSFVRDGGIFIFLYNTNLGLFKKSTSWRFHTLCDAEKHFSLYPNTRIFLVNKVDTILMKKYTFNPILTKLNTYISNAFGLGCELVCVYRKTEDSYETQ